MEPVIRQDFYKHNKLIRSLGRLAQMVERGLHKFSPQREVVRIPPAPGFFRVEFIPINTRLQIFEKCDGIWTRLNEKRKSIASLQYG